MTIFSMVKKLLFGNEPDDVGFYILFYGFAALLLAIIAPLMVSVAGIPIYAVIIASFFYIVLIVVIVRTLTFFLFGAREIYGTIHGNEDDESVPDFVREIEGYVQAGRFEEAIALYKKAYEMSPGDIQLLSRIGELYWIYLRDYMTALGYFHTVSTRTDDVKLRNDAVTRMMEIYRTHSFEGQEYEELCRWVMKNMPGTIAYKWAKEHLSKIGG